MVALIYFKTAFYYPEFSEMRETGKDNRMTSIPTNKVFAYL